MPMKVTKGVGGTITVKCDCGCGQTVIIPGSSVSVGGVITGTAPRPGRSAQPPVRPKRPTDPGDTVRTLIITSLAGEASDSERRLVARLTTVADPIITGEIPITELHTMATGLKQKLVDGVTDCDLTWKYRQSFPVSRLADEIAEQVGDAVGINVLHDALLDDDDSF